MHALKDQSCGLSEDIDKLGCGDLNCLWKAGHEVPALDLLDGVNTAL